MPCPIWWSLLMNQLVTVSHSFPPPEWSSFFQATSNCFCSADSFQMEDQLSALGERWSHVCQWAEQRSSSLTQLVSHWEQLDGDLSRLKSWLAAHEHSLRLIEANPNADRSQMIDVARQLQVNNVNIPNWVAHTPR